MTHNLTENKLFRTRDYRRDDDTNDFSFLKRYKSDGNRTYFDWEVCLITHTVLVQLIVMSFEHVW